jgi:hypothetical protein
MKKTIRTTLAVAALLPSCAYMQTNKNILERGVVHRGTELKAESLTLHKKGGQWYVGSPMSNFSKHYPTIHDEVFFKEDNSPTFKTIGEPEGKLYYPISAGTATCLQRTDGYAQTNALATEISSFQAAPIADMRGGSTYSIRAEVVDAAKPVTLITSHTPEHPGTGQRVLAAVDKYTVDAVGTLGYNIAIPFMAPFVFFSEFLSED